MGSDPLTYHAVETIDATTERQPNSSSLARASARKRSTAFRPRAQRPDTIQLAKSAFSYLTAGMTQAEDLAAVLSHATRTSSGLTISDTHGDSLTLAGLTPR